MANCLVTKLNGVVDNDNLEILGYSSVWFSKEKTESPSYPPRIFSNSPTPTECKIVYDDGTTESVYISKGGFTITNKQSGGKLYFPKYDWLYVLDDFTQENINIDMFEFQTSFYEARFISNKMCGHFSKLPPNIMYWQTQAAPGLATDRMSDTILDYKGIKLVRLSVANLNCAKGISVEDVGYTQVALGRTSGVLNLYLTYALSKIRFGSSMIEPTETDTERGFQIAWGLPEES